MEDIYDELDRLRDKKIDLLNEVRAIDKQIEELKDKCSHPREYRYICTGDGSVQCTLCKRWIR